MEESRRTEVLVNYDGKDISKQISEFLSMFTYSDEANGKSDSISIKLADRDELFIGSWRPTKGDRMDALIYTKNWELKGDNKKFACGSFLIDDLESAGPPTTVSIGSVSVPQNEEFRSEKRTYTWKNTSLSKIASDIASSAGVGLVFDATDIPIESIEQSEKTNCSFLYFLADTYGYSMKVYDSKIVIFSREKYEKKKSIATIKKSDDVKWRHKDTIQGTYTGAIFSYSDPNDEKDYIVHVGADGRKCSINVSADNIHDAELKGIAALNKMNQNAVVMNLTIPALPGLSSSSCIDVEGFGKLSGKYYIDKIKHSISGQSSYQMNLVIHKVIPWIKTVSIEVVEEISETSSNSIQYTVKSGDSLWSIAKAHLGDGSKYIKIYQDNQTVIESTAKAHGKASSNNGSFIWPGEVLVINR